MARLPQSAHNSTMNSSEKSDGIDGSLMMPSTTFTGFATCDDHTAPTVFTHLTKASSTPLDHGWVVVPHQSRLSIEVRWAKLPKSHPENEAKGDCTSFESQDCPARVQVRWRMERSMHGVLMDNCYYTVGLPSISSKDTSTPLAVLDAKSIEGQSDGAILVVQHIPRYDPEHAVRELVVEVDDHVKVLKHEANMLDHTHHVMVQHVRSGRYGLLRWSCFFKVGTRQLCGCSKQNCRCHYEDYGLSKAHYAPKKTMAALAKPAIAEVSKTTMQGPSKKASLVSAKSTASTTSSLL